MNQTNIHSKTICNRNWNPASGRTEFSFVFAFVNRDEYAEFVRGWKANYAELTLLLRRQKAAVIATMRSREYAGNEQVRLLELKAEATMQLAMRRSGKVESHRQYLLLREARK